MLLDQRQLCPRCIGLAEIHHILRALRLGQRRSGAVLPLRQFTAPLAALQRQVLIGQFHQHLSAGHRITRLCMHQAQVSVGRCHQHALYGTFEMRRGADAVIDRPVAQGEQQSERCDGNQLGQQLAGLGQAVAHAAGKLAQSAMPGAVGVALELEYRRHQGGELFAGVDQAGCQNAFGAELQRHRPNAGFLGYQRHRDNPCCTAPRHVGMRQTHPGTRLRVCRVADAGPLLHRFVHGGCQAAAQLGLLAEVGRARNRNNTGAAVFVHPHADPHGAEQGGKFARQGGGGGGKPPLRQQCRLHPQHSCSVHGWRARRQLGATQIDLAAHGRQQGSAGGSVHDPWAVAD